MASAAASRRGPSSWEYSMRKHCEVLTIPLDLRETEWMLLKLKKFVNAVCARTAELAAAKILPEQQSATEGFGDAKMPKNSLALTKRYDRLTPVLGLRSCSGKAHIPPSTA
jgi:hypothetical protein